MKEIVIDVKTLPSPLNTIIKGKTVRIYPAEDVMGLKAHPNRGERGYVRIIDPANGVDQTYQGSWGGANPFESHKADNEGLTMDIGRGCYILVGYEGGMYSSGIHYTSIHMNELDIPKQPDMNDVTLSEKETQALYLIRQYNSKGRTESFSRNGLGKYGKENPLVVSLASKGFLKIVGNGVSVLPEGHNLNIPRMSIW